ncbi:MAG: outer membrane protein assembly factor BamB [Gammaproteobacteria bacterium]|jgi:outer membrane protein assembly factor BamB|nr:outer membrane protein assembly factor BamB [Gammaproteobacteria bacterium]
MRLFLPLGIAALLIAAGCSKDKDVEPPAALLKFNGTLPVKKLWGDNVGGGKKQVKLRLGLGPSVADGIVFAASHKGEVLAVALDTGKQIWVKKLKLPLSAGPAAGSGMVILGSSKGTVIALDAANGHERWRMHVNSELLSAPAISEKVVVLRSVDGRLHGLDSASGKELWQVEQQVPRLSLRGTATPIIAKELAISGFDNGKVMAVSLTTGDTVWDTALASPHGRTELDRLVDIDSAVRVVGDDVFAAGFQGRTAMMALDSGQIWWAHDMSSYRGLAADGENLFVTQSDGAVVALHDRDGSELWRNEDIKRRGLSTPVETTTAVAVADYQGYVHWLDKKTGYLVARVRVSKFRVSNPPVAVDDTVVVLDDGGKMAAFRADPAHAATAVPAPKALPTKEQKKAAKAAAKEAAKAAKASAKAADKAAIKPAAPPPAAPAPVVPPPAAPQSVPPAEPPAAPPAPPTQP